MVGKIDFFEGAEKTLEIWFSSNIRSPNNDLRLIPQCEWDTLVETVDAKIISHIRSYDTIAFLLSESSLIVSKDRVIVKTCGTTKCLQSLELMIDLAQRYCGFDIVEDLFYSRRNFIQPAMQESMHSSFETEVTYLDSKIGGGAPYIMGKVNIDCWYLYTTVTHRKPAKVADQTFEVLMSGLDPHAMKEFYLEENETGQEATRRTGIDKIIPGSMIDSFQFEPCGYSANGLVDGGFYWTIHVTPEMEHSYVSFETNYPEVNYQKMLEKILQIFKPSHFNVVIRANKMSPTRLGLVSDGFQLANFTLNDLQHTHYPVYKMHYSSYDVNSLPDHC